MKIRLKNVRLSFPALFEPRAFLNDDKPAYSALFILEGYGADPMVEIGRPAADGRTDWSMKVPMSEVLAAVAKEKWGAKADAILKSLLASEKTCLHDGAHKSQYSGFEGSLYISARNPVVKPLVLDKTGKEVDPNSGLIYAGCYVHAVLEIYAQDNAYGKRINATITTVMFSQDGEAFGSGARGSVSDLEDLVVADELDDLM